MHIIKFDKDIIIDRLVERPTIDLEVLNNKVKPIVLDVKKNGDEALRKYALEFDNVLINDFQVSHQEISDSEFKIAPELKEAIDVAYQNIYAFHEKQVKHSEIIETMPGVQCWRKSVAIEKVGLYIPGGSAPLFSTVLMLGIPAKIAACKKTILCSPSKHPAILYSAKRCGIQEIYSIGGVQAITAMAFGTESIPKVDKIFGPGNQYVTAAKQIVNQMGVAIDMPAGPSELLIIADKRANAAFVAADLLSQAEHGPDSQVILISESLDVINEVIKEISRQIEKLPRKEIAELALENSKAICVESINQAIEISNAYAPEHLILAMANPDDILDKIVNAGSVFIGDYTPESCGDYASGTNHTLPTNGHARSHSGVSVDSFVKNITFQKITKEGIQNIGKTVEIMAEAEELLAHKNAVSLRLTAIKEAKK